MSINGENIKYDHTSVELLTQLNLMIDGKFTNAGYYLFSNKKPLVYKAVEYPTSERLDPIDLKGFEGRALFARTFETFHVFTASVLEDQNVGKSTIFSRDIIVKIL